MISEGLMGISDVLARNDISYAGLFGSTARGENGPNSDLDILIKFNKPKTLLDLVGLEDELTSRLHKKVDIVTENSLSPYIKDSILNDLQVFYGSR